FRPGNRNFHSEVAFDLRLELLIKPAFEFPDLATLQASNVNVVARTVSFVIVAVAAQVQKVQLVDQAMLLQQVNGAIDGHQMDVRIDDFGPLEDLIDVQV